MRGLSLLVILTDSAGEQLSRAFQNRIRCGGYQVRVHILEVTQCIEMHRASFDRFKVTCTQPLEVSLRRLRFEFAKNLLSSRQELGRPTAGAPLIRRA